MRGRAIRYWMTWSWTSTFVENSDEGVAMVVQPEKGMMSRHPAHSMYLRLTHKQWVSYGHALGLSDWRLVSGFDCVGTPE